MSLANYNIQTDYRDSKDFFFIFWNVQCCHLRNNSELIAKFYLKVY